MKIICIGRNYGSHNKEMGSAKPKVPLFFIKPETSLLMKNKSFYYPEFTQELHYEAEVVVRINRLGKYIGEKFAGQYYNEIAFGIDLTARDLQRECIANGNPWEICKGFEYSAPVSRFISLEEEGLDIDNIPFRLDINEKTVQEGNTHDMIFSIDEIIAYVSQFMTLKIGDLIFTGTPSGIGPLNVGDKLEGYIGHEQLLAMKIK